MSEWVWGSARKEDVRMSEQNGEKGWKWKFEVKREPTRSLLRRLVFFVQFQTFSKLRDCATKLIRPSDCAFHLKCQGHQCLQGLCGHEGNDTKCKMRRTHCAIQHLWLCSLSLPTNLSMCVHFKLPLWNNCLFVPEQVVNQCKTGFSRPPQTQSLSLLEHLFFLPHHDDATSMTQSFRVHSFCFSIFCTLLLMVSHHLPWHQSHTDQKHNSHPCPCLLAPSSPSPLSSLSFPLFFFSAQCALCICFFHLPNSSSVSPSFLININFLHDHFFLIPSPIWLGSPCVPFSPLLPILLLLLSACTLFSSSWTSFLLSDCHSSTQSKPVSQHWNAEALVPQHWNTEELHKPTTMNPVQNTHKFTHFSLPPTGVFTGIVNVKAMSTKQSTDSLKSMWSNSQCLQTNNHSVHSQSNPWL